MVLHTYTLAAHQGRVTVAALLQEGLLLFNAFGVQLVSGAWGSTPEFRIQDSLRPRMISLVGGSYGGGLRWLGQRTFTCA